MEIIFIVTFLLAIFYFGLWKIFIPVVSLFAMAYLISQTRAKKRAVKAAP